MLRILSGGQISILEIAKLSSHLQVFVTALQVSKTLSQKTSVFLKVLQMSKSLSKKATVSALNTITGMGIVQTWNAFTTLKPQLYDPRDTQYEHVCIYIYVYVSIFF